MERRWLLFCPQLPATPSSPRVTIWRRMRSAGAIGLDNGVWVLPHTESAAQFVREMQEYVASQTGMSKTFVVSSFDDETESAIIERFVNDRAEEYAELKEQCDDFLAELDKETKRGNFSFAEYEENEQDLLKLEAWFDKVTRRDFIGGRHAQETMEWLRKCHEEFERFAEEVFTHEDQDHAKKMRFDPGDVANRREGPKSRSDMESKA